MGIAGLLRLVVKQIGETKHLRELRGLRAGVDGYVWLHRGAFAVASELAEASVGGEEEAEATRRVVKYCVGLVRMMRSFGVEPVMVLDGAPLVSKRGVEHERASAREESLTRARELVKAGHASQAQRHFSRAVDVTPHMAHALVVELRKLSVECVVAPHEADAQLAYLDKIGHVDFCVSEDSDLLAFGCSRVLYKLDKDTGEGLMVDVRRLRFVSDPPLTVFSHDMFLDMCILAGCDYLESVDGVGLKRAHALVMEHRDPARVLRVLRAEKAGKLPSDYEARFWRARMTFKHQLVFCPVKGEVVPLSPVSVGSDLSFLGRFGVDKSVARGVARGDLHPVTFVAFGHGVGCVGDSGEGKENAPPDAAEAAEAKRVRARVVLDESSSPVAFLYPE